MNQRFKLLCRVCQIDPVLAWSVLGTEYQETEHPAMLAAWAGMQAAGLDTLSITRALFQLANVCRDGKQAPDYFCLYRCLPTDKPQPWRYLHWYPRHDRDPLFWDLLADKSCQELPQPPQALHTIMLIVLMGRYSRAADNIGTLVADAESAIANAGDAG